MKAKHVVLACPAFVSAQLLAAFDEDLADALHSIPYAPIAVVATGHRRGDIAHPLDGFGFLIPRREGLRTLGSIWTSSIFQDRSPAGYVQFRTMLGGAGDPAVMQLSDDDLWNTIRKELDPLIGIKRRAGDPARLSVAARDTAVHAAAPGTSPADRAARRPPPGPAHGRQCLLRRRAERLREDGLGRGCQNRCANRKQETGNRKPMSLSAATARLYRLLSIHRPLLIIAAMTLAAARGATAQAAADEPAGFLRKHAVLSASDFAALGRNEPVSKILQSRNSTEVAPFGAGRVSVPLDFFLEQYRDIVSFKKAPEVLQIGKFGRFRHCRISRG